jgi:tartrate dehydratase beta subunit/fumarate hydratase class I family protein
MSNASGTFRTDCHTIPTRIIEAKGVSADAIVAFKNLPAGWCVGAAAPTEAEAREALATEMARQLGVLYVIAIDTALSAEELRALAFKALHLPPDHGKPR